MCVKFLFGYMEMSSAVSLLKSLPTKKDLSDLLEKFFTVIRINSKKIYFAASVIKYDIYHRYTIGCKLKKKNSH